MSIFFQVNSQGTVFVNEELRKLESRSKPPMSFEYHTLTYSADEKTVYHNYTKRDLTEDEITEVENYISTIQENPELTHQFTRNAQAKHYLVQTDWYVVRFLETGQPIPEKITEMRALAREEIQ
jgi:hypothetical protein